jgi:hypothetical protein
VFVIAVSFALTTTYRHHPCQEKYPTNADEIIDFSKASTQLAVPRGTSKAIIWQSVAEKEIEHNISSIDDVRLLPPSARKSSNSSKTCEVLPRTALMTTTTTTTGIIAC